MRPAFGFSSLVLALTGGVFSPAASAACYRVYGPAQQVVYRSTQPPVDLSHPLHQTVPVLAPGATLVFSPDNHGCEVEVNLLLAQQSVPQGNALPEPWMRAPRAPRG